MNTVTHYLDFLKFEDETNEQKKLQIKLIIRKWKKY